MTNKEAIEELKPLTKYSIDKNGVVGTFPMVWRPEQVEALNLAIKALCIVNIIEDTYFDRDSNLMMDFDDWKDIKGFIENG